MFGMKVTIFAVLIVSLAAVSVFAQKTPLLTFDELKSYKIQNQTFQIFGTVLDIYKCPPCPPRAQCKPCFPNHLTIVEKIHPENPDSLVRLRVLTDKLDRFALGNRYLFTVKVYGTVAAGESITDVTLIRFEARPLVDR